MQVNTPCKDHGKTTSLRPEGYALVSKQGVRSRCVDLHRLVYAEKEGVTLVDIDGIVVRHTCDNPRCIEPTHLIGGTKADNNKDRAERGRSAKLVPSRQRLNESQVAYIRLMYSSVRGNPYSAKQLGRRFGVDSKVIYNVLKGNYNAAK